MTTTLSMRKQGEALMWDLSADGACTLAQAVRNRGWEALESLRRLGLAEVRWALYRPTAGSRGPIRVQAVRLTGKGMREAAERGMRPVSVPFRKLAHAFGMSELRSALGLDAREVVRGAEIEALWARHRSHGGGLPDAAVWHEGELVVLEYDHGKYSRDQVRCKLDFCEAVADRAVWGAPTEERARCLRKWGASEVVVVRPPVLAPRRL